MEGCGDVYTIYIATYSTIVESRVGFVCHAWVDGVNGTRLYVGGESRRIGVDSCVSFFIKMI